MARNFGGTTDLVSCGTDTGPDGATTWTSSCWFRRDATFADFAGIISHHDSTNTKIVMQGRSTNIVRAYVWRTAGDLTAESTGTMPLNTWAHLLMVYDDPNLDVYIDGTNDGSASGSAGSMDVGTAANVYLGHNVVGVKSAEGDLCEIAEWNVALNANEITALSNGVNPRYIRSGSLVHYWPLYGTHSTEPDFYLGTNDGTVTNTTVVNHAPVQPFSRFNNVINIDAVTTTRSERFSMMSFDQLEDQFIVDIDSSVGANDRATLLGFYEGIAFGGAGGSKKINLPLLGVG